MRSPNNYEDNVDRRLIIRQRIFFVIIFILITIGVVNIMEHKITAILGVSGFFLSSAVGLILSRMFKIFWHEEKEKVVSELDTIGSILLILYIAVEIGRNWLFGHWLSGPALTSFGLIILTGLLCGRFVGTHIKIKEVLENGDDNETITKSDICQKK